jgi:hypothetical protein
MRLSLACPLLHEFETMTDLGTTGTGASKLFLERLDRCVAVPQVALQLGNQAQGSGKGTLGIGSRGARGELPCDERVAGNRAGQKGVGCESATHERKLLR